MSLLETTLNTRDLGGIETKYGKIRKGALIRGAKLNKITTKDFEKLTKKYNFHTVIDLRSKREIEEKPDRQFKNINYISIPIFDKSTPGITHEEQPGGILKSKINMVDLYQEILTGEYLEKIGEVVRTIMNLEEDDYSVFLHCSAGKDRTGIITAILLTILGVNRDTIIKGDVFNRNNYGVPTNSGTVNRGGEFELPPEQQIN